MTMTATHYRLIHRLIRSLPQSLLWSGNKIRMTGAEAGAAGGGGQLFCGFADDDGGAMFVLDAVAVAAVAVVVEQLLLFALV
jgi:hypothetical protein